MQEPTEKLLHENVATIKQFALYPPHCSQLVVTMQMWKHSLGTRGHLHWMTTVFSTHISSPRRHMLSLFWIKNLHHHQCQWKVRYCVCLKMQHVKRYLNHCSLSCQTSYPGNPSQWATSHCDSEVAKTGWATSDGWGPARWDLYY